LNKSVVDIIHRDFSPEHHARVIAELSSVTVTHVMAQSEQNLEATRLAILKLANGDMTKVTEYTQRAKNDFRDVIWWADETRPRS